LKRLGWTLRSMGMGRRTWGVRCMTWAEGLGRGRRGCLMGWGRKEKKGRGVSICVGGER